MHRRRFLTSSTASLAAALTAHAAQASPIPPQAVAPSAVGDKPREFYQLRRYTLQSGPQTRITQHYFADALIPALGRLGMGPIGAFSVDIGPETPTYYLLIPGTDLDLLTSLDLRLAQDAEFMKAAEPFWSAPAVSPPFARIEASLHRAFEGWPRLVVPPKEKRVFQLRVYESPTYATHVRKVEMFHQGEFHVFQAAGLGPVFFSDTLIGPRQPSLTYLLSLPSVAELDARWNAFGTHPDWKKLVAQPRYSAEPIVCSITSLILSPLASSQI